MITDWGSFDTDLGNFGNWLSSTDGWVFYLLVFGLILLILVNLAAFSRRHKEPDELRTGPERTMAVVGGFITLVAQLLPWYRSGGSSGMGLGFGQGLAGASVSVFGLVWLTCFAIPKEPAAILGLVWGGPALMLTLMTLNTMAATAAAPSQWSYYIEYGVYASIFG